jgi:predicted nucleic acid-binding protein
MDRVALDTTFLIDLQNERRGRGPVQGATVFLESHLETIFFLPVVALGEYLEGFSDLACPEAWALVDPLNLLEVTEDVARIYAATVRHLRAAGLLIGTNDTMDRIHGPCGELAIGHAQRRALLADSGPPGGCVLKSANEPTMRCWTHQSWWGISAARTGRATS